MILPSICAESFIVPELRSVLLSPFGRSALFLSICRQHAYDRNTAINSNYRRWKTYISDIDFLVYKSFYDIGPDAKSFHVALIPTFSSQSVPIRIKEVWYKVERWRYWSVVSRTWYFIDRCQLKLSVAFPIGYLESNLGLILEKYY